MACSLHDCVFPLMTASTGFGTMEGRFDDAGATFVARPVGRILDTLVDGDSQETLACTPPLEEDVEDLEETTGPVCTQTLDSDVRPSVQVESVVQNFGRTGPPSGSLPSRFGLKPHEDALPAEPLLGTPTEVQPTVALDASTVCAAKIAPCALPKTDIDTGKLQTTKSAILTAAGDCGPTVVLADASSFGFANVPNTDVAASKCTTAEVLSTMQLAELPTQTDASCPRMFGTANASWVGGQDEGSLVRLAGMSTLNAATDLYCATVSDATPAGDVAPTLRVDETLTLRTSADVPQAIVADGSLAGETAVAPTVQLTEMHMITTDASSAIPSDPSLAGTLLDPPSATATVLDSTGCALDHVPGWPHASRQGATTHPGVSKGCRSSTVLDSTGRGADEAPPFWPSKDGSRSAARSDSNQLQRTPELLPDTHMWSTGELLADSRLPSQTMSPALCSAVTLGSRPAASPAPTETMHSDIWNASIMPPKNMLDEQLEPVPDEEPDLRNAPSRSLRNELRQSVTMMSDADAESWVQQQVPPANVDFTATLSCDDSPDLTVAQAARQFGRPCSETARTTTSWSFDSGGESASMDGQVAPHAVGLAASNSQVTVDSHSPGRSSHTSESNIETLVLGARTKLSKEQIEQVLENSASPARALSARVVGPAPDAEDTANNSEQQKRGVSTPPASDLAVSASCEALHDRCCSPFPPETSQVKERMPAQLQEESVDDLPATLPEPDTPLESQGSCHPSRVPSPPGPATLQLLPPPAPASMAISSAAREASLVPSALPSGERRSRTRLTGKRSLNEHLALQGINAAASTRRVTLKKWPTGVLSRSAASGLQASQGQIQAVASSIPPLVSACAAAASSTASSSQAPPAPQERHPGVTVQGHSFTPFDERGAQVRVRGDGWGGGSGEYVATITEADEFTFTVIRAATGEDDCAWEETHVLREHATVLPTWPAGVNRRRV